jgi:hypothetical protein
MLRIASPARIALIHSTKVETRGSPKELLHNGLLTI